MARRLPGFSFETVAPPAADTLPRMDIAVFVGFAASGPPHIPVAIEDPTQFREIFGDDLNLAYDPALQAPVVANLGPVIRSFFRNGGVRCWIIRVLGSAAETSLIPIPGLFGRDGAFTQTRARARSAGSWADNLQVAAELNGNAFGVDAFDLSALSADLAVRRPDDVAPGDLLRFHFRADGFLLLLRVSRVSPLPAGLSTGSIRIVGRDPLWAPTSSADDPCAWTSAAPPLSLTSFPDAELLTFDLIARLGDSGIQRLKNLGFFPDHPRYWAFIPTDVELYSREASLAGTLQTDAINPRFPLAGEEDLAPAYYPIGMPYLVTELPVRTLPVTPALERDGLASFNEALFLDPALIDAPVDDLMNEADFLRYISPAPRRLLGIHAALAIEEATIIAVPDANQRGWAPASYPPVPPPAPSDPLPHPEWWTFEPCPIDRIPLAAHPDWARFLRCDLLIVAAPVLEASPATPDGEYRLSWTTTPDAEYILEEALDPNWSDASTVYEGPHEHFAFSGRRSGAYYYRVRAIVGTVTSDWSNGIVVAVRRAGDYQVAAEEDYDPRLLIDVQRALLRMSAARGDYFAVLGLPRHYREPETLGHIAMLKGQPGSIRPLGGTELRAYSYGALYHSWLVAHEEQSNVILPPDGFACAVMAARTLRRGAWIAPANEPLESVIALENELSRDRWQEFLDLQINVCRQDPHGFLWMGADTLSEDPDLRPINVRRLLILLRRLALQRGAGYVFEPNSPTFARVVKYSFESMLGEMYDKGAFAGSTQASSFRVLTDAPVNTNATRDRGMFLVEIQVAPSQPMAFLTVRLTQTSDRATATEVA